METDSYWRTRCVGEAMDQGYSGGNHGTSPPSSPSAARSRSTGDGWLFELQLDSFRGLADTIQGPHALEERQPAEAVRTAARRPAPGIRVRRRDRGPRQGRAAEVQRPAEAYRRSRPRWSRSRRGPSSILN